MQIFEQLFKESFCVWKDSSDSRNGSVCWWFLMQVYINEKQNFEIAVRFWKAYLTMQNICCFLSKGFYIQYLL